MHQNEPTSFESSDFVSHNAGWFVTLSDGRRLHDDGQEPSSWLRLRSFLENQDVHITGLSIRRGNHYSQLADNCDGYSVVRGKWFFFETNTELDTIVACFTEKRGENTVWIRNVWCVRTMQQLECSEQSLDKYAKSGIFKDDWSDIGETLTNEDLDKVAEYLNETGQASM